MDNLKLVDYTDSSSEDENLDLKPDIEDIEFGVNVETKIKKIAVVSPLQQISANKQRGVINTPPHENPEEDIQINTQSPNSVHSNYDIIEIGSSPVESPNIIDVSSDSDTISYVNPLEEDQIQDDPFLEFDDVFSNKSCTSGNKNYTIFLTLIKI